MKDDLRSSSGEIQYKRKELKVVGDFTIGTRLGKGSYGVVKEAINNEKKKRVAIKICKENALRKIPGGLENVLEEIKILESLNHPNVIKMISHWKGEEKLYIVLEYVGGGNLTSLLKKLPNNKLNSNQARKVFKGLINGLEYLHNKGIIHGDIKPDNLLLTERGDVKITDFGVSMVTEEHVLPANDPQQEPGIFGQTLCGRGQGTVAFQPPEVVAGKVKFSVCGDRLDLWAAGIVLYIITVGEYPFKGTSIGSQLDNISSVSCNFPDDLEPELTDLLKQMFRKGDEEFVTIQNIKEHSWFNKDCSDIDVGSIPSIFERRKRGGYRVSPSFSGSNQDVTCCIL